MNIKRCALLINDIFSKNDFININWFAGIFQVWTIILSAEWLWSFCTILKRFYFG